MRKVSRNMRTGYSTCVHTTHGALLLGIKSSCTQSPFLLSVQTSYPIILLFLGLADTRASCRYLCFDVSRPVHRLTNLSIGIELTSRASGGTAQNLTLMMCHRSSWVDRHGNGVSSGGLELHSDPSRRQPCDRLRWFRSCHHW